MTHKEIITKFMIEYDKANVTSSYPSLTNYEIATILDKSYLILIALKFTGNNTRRASFEQDEKVISDLQPLIITETRQSSPSRRFYSDVLPDNMCDIDLPTNMLYFIQAAAAVDTNADAGWMNNNENQFSNADIKLVPIKLVNHNVAEKFFSTSYNKPWIKIPVGFIENNKFFVLSDPMVGLANQSISITFIKQPMKFTEDLDVSQSNVLFELSDSMAEELVSLGVSYALENVESSRINTHLGMRGLES